MEEKFVDVKGIRTRYLEGGTGEHLVLVHGGHYGMNCSANDWDLVFKGFEKSPLIKSDRINMILLFFILGNKGANIYFPVFDQHVPNGGVVIGVVEFQ